MPFTAALTTSPTPATPRIARWRGLLAGVAANVAAATNSAQAMQVVDLAQFSGNDADYIDDITGDGGVLKDVLEG